MEMASSGRRQLALPGTRQLWHGTDPESASSIYNGHFNRSYAGASNGK